jgi:hypothetical protein
VLCEASKPLHSKGQKYTYLFKCKKDGELFLTLKLHRNFNDTYRARVQITRPNDESMQKYKDGLGRASIRKKTRQRRKPSAKRRKAASEANE